MICPLCLVKAGSALITISAVGAYVLCDAHEGMACFCNPSRDMPPSIDVIASVDDAVRSGKYCNLIVVLLSKYVYVRYRPIADIGVAEKQTRPNVRVQPPPKAVGWNEWLGINRELAQRTLPSRAPLWC